MSRTAGRLSSRWVTGRDVGVALAMAIGLSTVFLSPYRFSPARRIETTRPTTSGRVLGTSIAVPLSAQVILRRGDQEWRTTTYPRTGMMAEALGQAAGAAGTSFEYQSRGSSIYLQRLFGQADDATGWWNISLNGLAMTDLSLRPLEQGDELLAEWRWR